MKKLILLALTGFLAFNVNAQMGKLETLNSKNGYKNITLGADISTLQKDKLTRLDDKPTRDSLDRFKYEDTSLYKISDKISLDAIIIASYKHKILTITIVYDKNDGYNILEIFEHAFGLYVEKPNQFMDIYHWYTQKVNLSVNFETSNRFGFATYTCNELQSEIDKKNLSAEKKAASDL